MADAAVEVVRGERVETRLRADVAVVDSVGRLRWWAGRPEAETYWRSGAKPFQALPLIESGVAVQFGLSEAELALAAGSHFGEPRHVDLVAAWLGRLDLHPGLLACGSVEDGAATAELARLRHNCSGKHAGMLTLAKALKVSPEQYWAPDHPVQERVRRSVERITGTRLPVAEDGCGVPTFYLSLARMAWAYARLGDPRGLDDTLTVACRTVAAAMAHHPELISGEGALEAQLAARSQGAVVAKRGAEGIFCLAVPALGIGVALKVEAGTARAVPPLVGRVLRTLEVADSSGRRWEDLEHRPLVNSLGHTVGEIRVGLALRSTRVG